MSSPIGPDDWDDASVVLNMFAGGHDVGSPDGLQSIRGMAEGTGNKKVREAMKMLVRGCRESLNNAHK